MATLNEQGFPDASYAPFVSDDDFNVYIFVSDIVERTQNLRANGKVSLLFIEDEADAKSIFGRRRCTMRAHAEFVDPSTAQDPAIKALFAEKFGDFVNLDLVGKSDFHLVKMVPFEGGITKGFGLAFKLKGEGLRQVEHLSEGHRSKR